MKKSHHNTGKTHSLKHGASSITVRQRFDDLRTSDGKALNSVLTALVDDLGGERNLTGAMRILINSSIRPKLITLSCISDYINKLQGEIIKDDGSLIGCLGTNYLAFSNALRLDLVALMDMAAKAGKSGKGVPSIEQLIKAHGK